MNEDEATRAFDRTPAGLDDLPPRHRLAILFADELMTSPGQLDEQLVRDLRANFTASELAELTVKVLKFNMQKVTVALGHDALMTDDTVAQARWAADGSFVAAPSNRRVDES